MKYREPVDPRELLGDLPWRNYIAFTSRSLRNRKIRSIRSEADLGRSRKKRSVCPKKMLEMKEYAGYHRKFSFRQLLVGQKSRVQLIVTFLSILELMKMGYIHVEQDALFDDILVEVVREP